MLDNLRILYKGDIVTFEYNGDTIKEYLQQLICSKTASVPRIERHLLAKSRTHVWFSAQSRKSYRFIMDVIPHTQITLVDDRVSNGSYTLLCYYSKL